MKKPSLLLLTLLLALGLTACGGKTEDSVMSASSSEAIDLEAAFWDITPVEDTVIPATVEPSQPDQSGAIAAYSSLAARFAGAEEPLDWSAAPETYGGAYIDNENGAVLTVCVTDLSPETRQVYFDACGTEDIAFRQVLYSYRALLAATEAITRYNASHSEPICQVWGVNEMENCVDITVPAALAAEAERLQRDHPCIRYALDEPVLVPADHSDMAQDDQIRFATERSTYSSDTQRIGFTVTNGWDVVLNFGEPTLDILLEGAWYSVPYRADAAFDASLPTVMAGETRTYACWTQVFHTDFPAGTYRLCLPYCQNYSPMNGQDWDHMAFAEFTVPEP